MRLQVGWAHRQEFDGALQVESAARVLARTGCARSVGGIGPCPGLFARAGRTRV